MNVYADGVSVITPFYNGNRFINETIRSVATQGHAHGPVEIVLCVDHGSEEPKIDPDLRGMVRIVENDQDSSGAGVARAVAIKAARMRYLGFLDADDLWAADKLAIQLGRMKTDGLAFSFGGYSEFTCQSTIRRYAPHGPYTLGGFLSKGFTVGCLTVMVDRAFDLPVRLTALRRRNDYFMWYFMLRACETRGLPWAGLPEILGHRRLHDANMTRGNLQNLLYNYRFYRAVDLPAARAATLTLSNVGRTALRKLTSMRGQA